MMKPSTPLHSIKIITNPQMIEVKRVEHDTPDRFIEYGPEDETWRVFLGFVEYKRLPSDRYIRFGNVVYVHPDLLATIIKATQDAGVKVEV